MKKYECLIIILFFVMLANAQQDKAINYQTLVEFYEDNAFDSILEINQDKLINDFQDQAGDIYEIYANTYEILNQDDKAFDNYIKAKSFYQANGELEKVAQINSGMYFLVNALSKTNENLDSETYLKELGDYATSVNSDKWLMAYYNLMGVEYFYPTQKDSAKYYFSKANSLATKIDSSKASSRILINMGVVQLNLYNQPDSAVYYYNKALSVYLLDDDEDKELNLLFDLYNNFGRAYVEQQNYSNAIEYYKKAEKIDLKKFNDLSKRLLYSNMQANYYYLSDWENAYNYLYMYDSINEVINLNDQKYNIKDIQEKYNNEKLRADNLEIESKRIQSRNLSYGLGASIVLGGIILLLFFKNRKRKQELINQLQEVETQKLANQLKEQELKSIDAMIEGQEKERQRIANDLHDDLGSLIANVKLHFNALQVKENPGLFDKTNLLIEEAYQKVRTVAHAKNSGVIAKQGLLIAVQNMADKISTANKIQIEVIDHGLEERLENNLELSIFRMIQELTTNVIKHAHATEATLHLTHHEDSLNIMVEDNGVGFNPSQVTKTNAGMGISSIDKRVSHLGGSMTIESEPNKGTTVIIDIPIE